MRWLTASHLVFPPHGDDGRHASQDRGKAPKTDARRSPNTAPQVIPVSLGSAREARPIGSLLRMT